MDCSPASKQATSIKGKWLTYFFPARPFIAMPLWSRKVNLNIKSKSVGI